MALIRIINPNSNTRVTDAMSAALEPLRMQGGPRLECVTLEQGPPGVESQAHVSQVEPLLARRIESDNEADAFVIACYSDPAYTCAANSLRGRCSALRNAPSSPP